MECVIYIEEVGVSVCFLSWFSRCFRRVGKVWGGCGGGLWLVDQVYYGNQWMSMNKE